MKLAVALLVLLASTASAGTSYSGFIATSTPLTYLPTGGVTEALAPCDPSSSANGLDGQWFELPAAAGAPWVLTMDATLDADVNFFGAACNYLSTTNAGLVGEPEAGSVPSGAAYLLVTGFAGAGAFTFTLG